MTIRAVIWDVGGVLVRTEDPAPRLKLAARLGISDQDLETVVFGDPQHMQAQLGQIHARQQWEQACQVVGWPLEDVEGFRQAFFEGDRLDADLVDYIRSLRPRYLTGLLSNAMDDVRSQIEGQWKMADAFDAMIISAEIGLVKPDPLIFHAALQALNIPPAEAVFIDDFERNILGAQAVGLHTIHFTNPAQVRSDLDSLLRQS